MTKIRYVSISTLLKLMTFAVSAVFTADAVAAPPDFQRDVQPLLKTYCVRCHGEKKKEGKVDIASLSAAKSVLQNRKSWQRVLEKLKDGEMPPEKPLPTDAERKRLIDWIERATKIDLSKIKHPGHVTIPRLTRDEYNNTLRDLLGVDLKPADSFSIDGEGESGFNNDRDALFIAPALMEKYFAAADKSLETLIALRSKPVDLRYEAEKMHMTERNTPKQPFGYILNRGQMTLYDSVAFPRSGTYTFTVRAWSTGSPTGARLRINDVVMGDIIVPSREPAEYRLTCEVKAGTYQMAWNIQQPANRRSKSDNGRAIEDAGRKKTKKKNAKSDNQTITGWAQKNAPVFPAGKNEAAQIRQLRTRLNNAAYGLQRPYEWLRLLTPQGDKSEITRFKGYIADRTPAVTAAKAALAKALGITADEFEKQWQKHNTARLADNKKLLDAVTGIKAPAKRKKKQKKQTPKQRAGNIAIDWIRIQGPAAPKDLPRQPVVFIAQPSKTLSKRAVAERIISRFATRAFRRPASPDEIARYLKLFDKADTRGDDFPHAVKLPLTAILVSPHFLFRTEFGPAKEGEFRLNDYQLASRLSYFLWMSMPDEELFDLAAKNRLHEPATLRRQVLRMLKAPKSQAFSRAFVEQWMGVGALRKAIGPDGKKFPMFTPSLKEAMIAEPVLFVDDLFRNDRSLLRLIDARETFLNEELAKLYGVSGVKGPEMRRVTLADKRRGGVLGMAGVLTVTSLPLRTSPVIRGKWVLETLLGEDQPDPPPNVPVLDREAGEKQGKSLREIYALHRSKPSCASCHQRMDPIGFGLQNFDPVGRWRDKHAGKPVDSSGVLPGGKKFNGPAELRGILIKRKSDIARNLSQKVLSFALGRRLEYFDGLAIRNIATSLEAADYKPSALILAIVESYPFRYQHSNPVAKEPK